MIVPDRTKPEQSLYVLGAETIRALKECGEESDIFGLYESVKGQRRQHTFSQHLMTLVWLFLLGAVVLTPEGKVSLCC